MKLEEIRTALQKHSKGELHAIITELYKAMPKSVKEDSAVDTLINEPKTYLHNGKSAKKRSKAIDIEVLRSEVEEFLDNAQEGLYYIPNQVVPKNQRSKWRFIVKDYYKDLLKASENPDHVPVAAQLLEKLFALLSYGCGYATFSSDDPFASVQIAQTEFFAHVVDLKFKSEPLETFISNAIKLILDSNVSRTTVTEDLTEVFIASLKTPAMREMVLAECENQIQETKKTKKVEDKKNYSSWDRNEYDREERINNLAELYFHCSASLYEFERGIEFYKKYYERRDKEISLFCLLELLFKFKQKELWLREYDEAVKSSVTPRDNLRKTYRHIKETGRMPEHLLH